MYLNGITYDMLYMAAPSSDSMPTNGKGVKRKDGRFYLSRSHLLSCVVGILAKSWLYCRMLVISLFLFVAAPGVVSLVVLHD